MLYEFLTKTLTVWRDERSGGTGLAQSRPGDLWQVEDKAGTSSMAVTHACLLQGAKFQSGMKERC